MNIPVNKTLVLNVLDLAQLIEDRYCMRLVPPPPGLYVKGRDKPLIVPGKRYYRLEEDGLLIELAISSLSDLRGEIFNAQHELISSDKIKQAISTLPSLPVVSLRIIYAIVERVLHASSAWARNASLCAYADVIKEFIRPEFQVEAFIQEVTDMVLNLTTELRSQIVEFIGEDKWIMHFQRPRGADICIEKTIDFRVYDWTRRMESGEWL